MENLTNSNSISSSNNCCFIKFIFIFPSNILRTNKKWIFAFVHPFISVTTASSNVSYQFQFYPANRNRFSTPIVVLSSWTFCVIEAQKQITIVLILLLSCNKLGV